MVNTEQSFFRNSNSEKVFSSFDPLGKIALRINHDKRDILGIRLWFDLSLLSGRHEFIRFLYDNLECLMKYSIHRNEHKNHTSYNN